MFKIVVTTYNSERWIGKCLMNIQTQTVKEFNCVFVDDASTDDVFEIARKAVADDKRFKIIRNEQNMKQMYSINRGITELRPGDQDMIVQIDGDDWLKHNKVLERVKREYDNRAWLTYGQFEYYPSGKVGPCEAYPSQILQNRDFRKYKWIGSHLKTFRYFLFRRIKTKDFFDDRGKWLTSAADMSFMLPMLEMAGPWISFIPDILYVYNEINPLSRDKVALEDQLRCGQLIRAKKKYPLLGC